MIKKRNARKKLHSRHMIVIGTSLAVIIILNFQILYTLNPPISDLHQQEVDRYSKLLPKQSIDEEIIDLMGTGYIPSVVAAIIHNDTITWSKGYGDQPSLDTIHFIASITKTITATAILQLYEQELFELDDDVNLYLPFSLRNPHYPETPITFRMLLSHTSGINGSQDDYWGVTFEDLYRKMGIINETESFPAYPTWLSEYLVPNGSLYTTNVWGTSMPGSEQATSYANSGFDLLGYLIEILSNTTLEQYLEEHIFTPLEMTSTGFSMTKFPQDKIAIPYWWNGTKNDIEPLPHYDCYAFGAGALRTTITDLSRFLIAHMHEGTINGTKILEKETIELMHDHTHSSIGNGYGFGWSRDNNPRWTGHNGGMPGTRTQMWYTEPDEDIPYPIGVIVFGNQGAVAGDAITAIRDKLFEIALEIASTENTVINTPGFTVVNVICIITVIAVIMIKKKHFEC